MRDKLTSPIAGRFFEIQEPGWRTRDARLCMDFVGVHTNFKAGGAETSGFCRSLGKSLKLFSPKNLTIAVGCVIIIKL